MMPCLASMAACALRAGDVLAVQALVEVDGGVDLLHDGVGARGEAAAPHLLLMLPL